MNGTPPHAAAPILVEIGAGELIDKITILEIKADRIGEASRLANVRHELAALQAARSTQLGRLTTELTQLEAELKTVNLRLWTIEDEIRACETRHEFGAEFVKLARAVYKTNDRRAALKRHINLVTGARIVEEKSYTGARAG